MECAYARDQYRRLLYIEKVMELLRILFLKIHFIYIYTTDHTLLAG